MKVAVIYAFYIINDNVHYFLHHAMKRTKVKDVDYIFVCNDIENYKLSDYIKPLVTKLIFRENSKLDFGGYSLIVNKYLDIKKYDYFIFLNDTTRGPIHDHIDWITQMTSLINNRVKLVGQTINCAGINGIIDPINLAHVQSYCFCLDQISLKIIIDNHFFDSIPEKKVEIIVEKEIGLSKLILKHNYNIACVLDIYKNFNFLELENKKYYNDLTLYTEELDIFKNVNFFKTNRFKTKLFYLNFLPTEKENSSIHLQNFFKSSEDLKCYNEIHKMYHNNSWIGHVEFSFFLLKMFNIKYTIDLGYLVSVEIFSSDSIVYTTSENYSLLNKNQKSTNLRNISHFSHDINKESLLKSDIILLNLIVIDHKYEVKTLIDKWLTKLQYLQCSYIILIHNILDNTVFNDLFILKLYKTYFIHSNGLIVLSSDENIIEIINIHWKSKIINHKDSDQFPNKLYHLDYHILITDIDN